MRTQPAEGQPIAMRVAHEPPAGGYVILRVNPDRDCDCPRCTGEQQDD